MVAAAGGGCPTKECVLCHSDYTEQLLDIFAHQIQSEHYGGNKSLSIEGISLEQLSASTQPLLLFSKKSCTCNTVFQSFLSYDNNQDADRTSTYNKRVIELLTNRKHFSNLIKIWENTDG